MEYDIESILEMYEDDYNPDPRPMNQGPVTMAQGGRTGFFKAGIVKQGPNTGKWSVADFDADSRRTVFFESEELANKAIADRKIKTSRYEKSRNILNDPKLKKQFIKYGNGKNVTGKMIREKFKISKEEFTQGGLRDLFDKDFTKFSKGQIKQKTIKNMVLLHNNKLSKNYITKGLIVPDNIIEKLGLNSSEAATATTRLSQHYGGFDFGFDELKNIKRNANSSNKLFEAMDKFAFGNPYRSSLYRTSLELIDEQLGNERGTFSSLKDKARKVLKKNGIKGFDINEIAGVTGTAKSGGGEFSQFMDVMDSNLNQKEMASFQSAFSRARKNIKNNPKNFATLSKQINKLTADFEKRYNVKLPRIRNSADVKKYYSPKRLQELKDQGLDIKKASKKLKYTIQMPKGASTINEFVNDPKRQLKTLLGKFEAHGCKGKAAGGRILFAEGTPNGAITTCAKKGVARFMDDLKKGNYSKASLNILKGGGNLIKNIANPMDLLKLKNLIGPGALGLMAAWEGGVITDDVIRQGTPLNESLANNWLTKTFLPYTQEYAKAKNLLESGTVPSNMKKYVQDVVTFNESLKDIQGIENRVSSRLIDDTGYGMIDGSSVYSQKQQDKEDADVMKKISSITDYNFLTPGTAKDLEYNALKDEMEATRMAKKEFSPIFGFDKLKDVRTPGSTSFDYIPDETPKDFRPITYKDAEYEDKKLPLGLEQAYMNKFNLKPRDSLSKYTFDDSDKNVLEELTETYNKSERAEQASQYPGYYGTQEKFMEGGIASLMKKKND